MEWKSFSVFISSTFADMHCERDYLKTHVFPQLNEELRPYGITLREVDLRWGINTTNLSQEDVEQKVMRVCFDEIDRSRPFFIGLIGNRYGWIPPAKTAVFFAKKGIHEFNSITSMEMEYCFLNQDLVSGCLFLERDATCLSLMDDETRAQYDDAYSMDIIVREKNPAKLLSLKQSIKKHLQEIGKEDCYQVYSPHWNGKSFDHLALFGELVKNAMLKEILSRYGISEDEVPFQDASHLQQGFLFNKQKSVSPRCHVMETLTHKIKDGKGVLVVAGASGSGKSCLYAQLVSHFQKQSERYLVLYHATAADDRSRELIPMLQRWNYELETAFSLLHRETQSLEDTTAYFLQLIRMTPEGKKLLLFLDATDGFNKTQWTEYLTFFPKSLSDRWMLICTTLPPYVQAIRQYHRSVDEYQLPPLDRDEAFKLMNVVTAYGCKELYSENVNNLLAKNGEDGPCYQSPLWLSLALNCMIYLGENDFFRISRMESDFNQGFICYVNDKIKAFPPQESMLFLNFLEELAESLGPFPIRLFHYLSISYKGLDEEILEALFADEWDPVKFAFTRRFFRDFLAEQGGEKSWTIMHEKCRIALPKDTIRVLSRKIAETYILKLEHGDRVNDNVFHFLMQSQDIQLTQRYFGLCHPDMDRFMKEVSQVSGACDPQALTFFLFETFAYRHKSGLLQWYPKALLYLDLRKIVVSIASEANRIGQYERSLSYLDAFTEFIEKGKVSTDIKIIIYILTDPEREKAEEQLLDSDGRKASFQKSLERAKVRGPLSLFIVPIVRKYYQWRITKLS